MSDRTRQFGTGQQHRDATVSAVERAVAELRRGAAVVLRDDSGNDTAVLVAAAEMAAAAAPAIAGAGTAPACVIPRTRAAALLARVPEGGSAVAVPCGHARDGGLDIEFVRDVAGAAAEDADLKDFGTAAANQLQEAAVELVKLARLLPVAVVAPVPVDAAAFAAQEGLLTVDSGAIRAYRDRIEDGAVTLAAHAPVPLEGAEHAVLYAFRPDDGGKEHLAIVIGDPPPDEPVLVRIHSECFTGDLLGSLRCDCGEQLRGAIRAIAEQGGGVLLYLAQEGRGIGLINKLRAYRLQDAGFDTIEANERLGFEADARAYRPAARMLRALGIASVRLLTNNPAKVAGLSACGISVVERVPHAFPANGHNDRYLSTKAARAGHLL